MALLALAPTAIREHPRVAHAAAADRRVRRLAVLRRRGAHAGDLGALGGRGPGGRHRGASSPTSCRSPSACWSACSCCSGAAPRAVGALFGPVTLALVRRASAPPASAASRDAPQVLAALNPLHALAFLDQPRRRVLRRAGLRGARGHRRRGALRRHGPLRQDARSASAWFSLVVPALVLNYFGQGALLLARPEAVQNPFYLLAARAGRSTRWSALATAATVIASQAVISGAYSMTRQAMQLGFLPRMNDRAHLGARDRPDLHPERQLAAAASAVRRGGDRLRLVLAPRRRLRRRGHGDHAGRHAAHLLRDALPVALPAVAVRPGHRLLPGHRRGVLLRRRCSRSPTAAGSRSSSAPPCSP